MRKLIALFIVIFTGCNDTEVIQSEKFVPARPVSAIISDTVGGVFSGAWTAVQIPFEDIGVKKQQIPELLQDISKNPYILPQPLSCENLRRQIAELDALLGPDICTLENQSTTVSSSKGEYIEQGALIARDQAVGVVSGKMSIIPFRGVVRQVSGANKHAKLVERAYQAGKLRRAFLKGLMKPIEKNCLNQSIPP